MEKRKAVETFCIVLKDFLEDLYKSYPDPSLFLLKKTTGLMMTSSPTQVIENFMDCVEPYRQKLLEKDESFFMNGGLATNLVKTQYSFLVDELNKISEIWKDEKTTQKTKESIWKYFHILITIGSKCR